MKILQINSVVGIKSTGRICADIADILRENGHDCLIAYGREKAAEKYKDICIRTDSTIGVKMHALQSRIFDNAGFTRKKATKKFIEKIRQYKPDIIHLHNIHGYYINVEELFLYLQQVDIPIVWTLHDCWAFTGHCTYPSRINCEKWRQQCFNCEQKNNYPISKVVDASRNNYNLKKRLFTNIKNMSIITPSEWLAGFAKASFLSKYPIEVIHNGIDTEVFVYRESDFKNKYLIANRKIVLGVASSWGKTKGLNDFILLSQKLKKEYCIVLVGINKKQKNLLPKNIIAIEQTNSPIELAEIYSAADVFVNLTYADNYPTVNLEAQACGTPVITYKTGGSIESVPASQIVEQGDLEGVIKLIAEICEKDKYMLFERDVFDRRKTFEKYLDIYKAKMV